MDSITFANAPTLPEGKRPWGADVEKVNAYAFYEMARELIIVHSLSDEVSTRDAVIPVMNARNRMRAILGGEPIPLGVSRKTAADLAGTLDSLWSVFTVDDGEGGRKFQWPAEGSTFEPWQLSWYRNALEKFETVFSAEMGDAATYVVPRRGIFSTAALVDTADETFPAEIRGAIPNKTLDDWRAAGRCLAFGLMSASGFHVARAVEGTIEKYYMTFTGKTDTLNGWYDYIKALKDVSGPKVPSDKTLTELEQMKDDYRNPLMHPRVVLTEAEARILFANGESLIIAMAGEIKAATELPLTGGGVAGLLANPES